MSKKTVKLISTITIVLFAIMMATSTCLAINTSDINGNATLAGGGSDKLKNAGNQIATIIRTVGIVAAVIILMILGIKYMMGSASEKAEYKKTMIPYVVGAVILFGASAIAGAVVDLAGGITGNA